MRPYLVVSLMLTGKRRVMFFKRAFWATTMWRVEYTRSRTCSCDREHVHSRTGGKSIINLATQTGWKCAGAVLTALVYSIYLLLRHFSLMRWVHWWVRSKTHCVESYRNKRVPNCIASWQVSKYRKLTYRWLKESMQDRIVMNLRIYTPSNNHVIT